VATAVAVTLPKLTVAAETGFTVTRLREFVATTLSDAVLQALLDAALSAIDDAIGPPGERADLVTVDGDLLPLAFRAERITSVVENARYSPLTLAADDYELSDSRRMLIRLRTGTNPSSCWRGRIRPTYVPVDNTAERIRVAVELVKLAITFSPGLASQSIGTWSEAYQTGVPYSEQRAAILASLSDGFGIR
jgi:hypothetical protein